MEETWLLRRVLAEKERARSGWRGWTRRQEMSRGSRPAHRLLLPSQRPPAAASPPTGSPPPRPRPPALGSASAPLACPMATVLATPASPSPEPSAPQPGGAGRSFSARAEESRLRLAYLLLLLQPLHGNLELPLFLAGLGDGGLVLLLVRHGHHGQDEVYQVEGAQEDDHHEEHHVGLPSGAQRLRAEAASP